MSTPASEQTTGTPVANNTFRTPAPDVSWTDLGQELWSYLTGRGAAINYSFVGLQVQVPRDTGEDAPRATWQLDGTLRITTSDDEFTGADPHRR
jgi:hypothetical protein